MQCSEIWSACPLPWVGRVVNLTRVKPCVNWPPSDVESGRRFSHLELAPEIPEAGVGEVQDDRRARALADVRDARHTAPAVNASLRRRLERWRAGRGAQPHRCLALGVGGEVRERGGLPRGDQGSARPCDGVGLS